MIGHGGANMSLTLHLTPETEAKLRDQAAFSGKKPEELALEALRPPGH